MTNEEREESTRYARNAMGILASAADMLAKVPNPIAALAGAGVGTIARTIDAMLGEHGVQETKRRIAQLHARRDEGAITDELLAADDRKVHDAVHDLYRPGVPINAPPPEPDTLPPPFPHPPLTPTKKKSRKSGSDGE